MDKEFNKIVGFLKALADANRLMIVDMLSCGELCACRILEEFHITQPTLSHHMKILCASGLVVGRKDGRWTYYSLNEEAVKSLQKYLVSITSDRRLEAKPPCDGFGENCGN